MILESEHGTRNKTNYPNRRFEYDAGSLLKDKDVWFWGGTKFVQYYKILH